MEYIIKTVGQGAGISCKPPDEYSKRLGKYCILKIIELQDESLPSKINESIIEEIKNRECKKIC